MGRWDEKKKKDEFMVTIGITRYRIVNYMYFGLGLCFGVVLSLVIL